MLKKIGGALLIVALLQGMAFAADFAPKAKFKVDGDEYKAIFSQVKERKTLNPYDYDSPEVFANFRAISTSGLKPNLLYRSSNPFNVEGNKLRHAVVDRLASEAGIQTEIDLSDSDKELQSFFKKSAVRKKYCYGIYENGRLYNVHMKGNGGYSYNWPHLAEALRFMLANEGPYLLHCTLGRDRGGLISMLCAALAGATVEELRKDYMTTYVNYYHVKPDSYEYNLIQKVRCDRKLYYIAYPECATDLKGMPAEYNVRGIVPEEAAVNFCSKALGLSQDEINALQKLFKVEK